MVGGYLLSVTDDTVFEALRAWMLTVIGGASFTATCASGVVTVSDVDGSIAVGQEVRGSVVQAGTTIATVGVAPSTYIFDPVPADFAGAELTSGFEVVQGTVNRVVTPTDSYAVLTKLGKTRLSTNREEYDTDETDAEIETNETHLDFMVQLDAYGDSASDVAIALQMAFRSISACAMLAPSNIQPLYADDPRQTAFIDGENQYAPRWTTTLHLQYNPVLTSPTELMTTATIGIINVDAAYPPTN